ARANDARGASWAAGAVRQLGQSRGNLAVRAGHPVHEAASDLRDVGTIRKRPAQTRRFADRTDLGHAGLVLPSRVPATVPSALSQRRGPRAGRLRTLRDRRRARENRALGKSLLGKEQRITTETRRHREEGEREIGK